MAETGNGEYSFKLKIDNQQLNLDIEQAKKAFADLAKQAKKAGAAFDDIPNPFEQFTGGAPKVKEARKQFDALSMSVSQLARETPALAMGVNTYILAISNNLPVFADAVKKVRAENDALAAQGKPTVSVLKQIGSALINWQTLLIAVVTALAMNGDKVWAWVKGLFGAKDALDDVARAEKELHQVRLQGALDAQEEVTKIRLTVQAAQDATASIEERTNAIRTLKEEYPEYFANLSNEQIMYGDIADSVQALVDKIIALAQARKAFNQLVENEENMRLLESVEGYAKLRNELDRHAGSGHKKYRHTQQTGVDTGTMFLPTGYEYVESDDTKWNRTDVLTESYKRVLDAQDTFLDNLETMGKNGNKEAKALFEKISEEYDGDVDAFIKATQASNAKLEEDAQGVIADGANAAAEAELRAAELRAKRIADTSARLVADATKARTQAEVDAMADGINKKIAQINLDYDLEEQAITKREEELRKLRGGMLTKQEEDSIAAMRSANKANRDRDINAANASESARIAAETKKSQEAWNEYLIQYGTFKEKQNAITDKYNAEIANAKTEGERKALEAERDAILAEYTLLASGYAEELAAKTAEEIDKLLTDLKGQVDAKQTAFDALDSSDSVDAKQLQNEINELRAKIKLLEQAAGKAKKEVSNKDWDESVQTFQNIANSAMEAANGIAEFDEGLGDTLRSIAQLASSGLNLVVVIKKITEAAWTGATAIKTLEKASLILAAISAAIQVVSAVVNAFKSSGDEVEQTKRQFKELNDELERSRKLARIDSVEGTIFGPNPFGNFINNLQAMQDALKNFEASKEAIMNQMHGGVRFGNDGKPIMEFNPYDNLKDAISNMRVMTKHKTWFSDREYADLGDLMPDLFDEFGDVTLEGLQNLQNSDVWKKLGEKDRELIEQMIADWEDYNAAVEATEKYLSDIFGDMGNELSDALVDAFENGTDAAQAFGDVVNNVMKRLASDIVNTALFDPILKDAEDKAFALNNQLKAGEITYDEYLAALKELMTDTTNQLLDLKDEAADTYEAAGIKQGSGSSYATSKGFQTMSQQTGSELNGRFTDIQGQVHIIAEAVEFNRSINVQQTKVLQSVNDTLAQIHNDTVAIEKHTRVLDDMSKDIAAMRRTMDNGAF